MILNRKSKVVWQEGFTLLEVALSVALVSIGLATLIAMQVKLADAYQREENLTKAALYGQYILTFIEVDRDPPEEGTEDGNLVDKLEELGFFDYMPDFEDKSALKAELEGWSFVQEVNVQPMLPAAIVEGADEDVFKRIDLEIRWGEKSNNAYHLIYFMNSPSSFQ